MLILLILIILFLNDLFFVFYEKQVMQLKMIVHYEPLIVF